MSVKPQRQDGLDDQLADVVRLATAEGCYDAADWIRRAADLPRPGAGRAATLDRIERELAALRADERAPGSAEGLRDALAIIDAAIEAWRTGPDPVAEPPYWAATNALIQAIAVAEGKSIGEVSDELRAAAPNV